ncbi:MAG TPA: rod shape-determining protein MreD [Gemmatimonadota bacterium]
MSIAGSERLATLRSAPDRLSVGTRARFAALIGVFLLGRLVLQERIAFGAVAPDFYVMALVFSAVRWGSLWGSVLGFVLGLNADALEVDRFGMHALAYTVAGFAVGKLKEALYLDVPALDLGLLAAAALATGVITTLLGAPDAVAAFEERFFREVPASALYTAALGGLLFRLVRE